MISINFDDGRLSAFTNGIPILLNAGFKNTNFIETGDIKNGTPSYINAEQIRYLRDHGMEIGAHTINHVSLTGLNEQQIRGEIVGGINDLNDMGISNIKTFAYPFGDFNDTVIKVVKEIGLIGARLANGLINGRDTDPYKINAFTLGPNTSLVQIKGWIDTAKRDNKWAVIVVHLIDDTGGPDTISAADFQTIVNYIKEVNIPVVTMTQGISRISQLSQ